MVFVVNKFHAHFLIVTFNLGKRYAMPMYLNLLNVFPQKPTGSADRIYKKKTNLVKRYAMLMYLNLIDYK